MNECCCVCVFLSQVNRSNGCCLLYDAPQTEVFIMVPASAGSMCNNVQKAVRSLHENVTPGEKENDGFR